MLRSIHAECYKVVHRPYFWITATLCALFSVGVVFCLYLIKREASGVTPITMPFALASFSHAAFFSPSGSLRAPKYPLCDCASPRPSMKK